MAAEMSPVGRSLLHSCSGGARLVSRLDRLPVSEEVAPLYPSPAASWFWLGLRDTALRVVRIGARAVCFWGLFEQWFLHRGFILSGSFLGSVNPSLRVF